MAESANPFLKVASKEIDRHISSDQLTNEWLADLLLQTMEESQVEVEQAVGLQPDRPRKRTPAEVAEALRRRKL